MEYDEIERHGGRPSDRLDPDFLKRLEGLEEDSRWSYEPLVREGRRADERRRSGGRSHSRMERRTRLVALLVFITLLVVIVVVSLSAGGSAESAGGRSVPFSLLPLDGSAITSTTIPESSTTTTETTSTATTILTPTVLAAEPATAALAGGAAETVSLERVSWPFSSAHLVSLPVSSLVLR
jgi:hypothetical protein